MDYEKKYKEALGWMQSVYPTMTGVVKEDAEHYFPELKESEDEKIRKELLNHLKEASYGKTLVVSTLDYKRWAEWLEKQGEQKPIFEMKTPEESLGIDSDTYNKIVDECIYGEQKPTDNKGMNLVEEKMTPFQKKVFCIIDTTIEEEQGLKQVCDELLALASNEIKQKHAETEKGAKGNDREIPFDAWSEEDEEQLDRAIYMMEQLDMTNSWDDVYNWLKSLKDRIQPQTTWKPTKEQMDALLFVVQHYTPNVTNKLAWDSIKILELMYYEIKH